MHYEAAGPIVVIGDRKETHHTSDRSARQSILRPSGVNGFACVSPSATCSADTGI